MSSARFGAGRHGERGPGERTDLAHTRNIRRSAMMNVTPNSTTPFGWDDEVRLRRTARRT